jgi:hypothetical protein
MSQNGHVMTNTETSEVIYFIDFVGSNTKYSIDILTYPAPTALPDGYSATFTFPESAKNPILNFHPKSTIFLVMPKISNRFSK